MKLLITTIICIALIGFTVSCDRKVNCVTQTITGFATYVDTTDSIANFIEYTKGSNFTGFVDSSGSVPFYVYTVPGVSACGQALFPNSGNDTYNYDWIIILKPSGRTYQLKNISHQNNYIKESTNNGIDDYCVNNISCLINDSPYVSQPIGNTQGPIQAFIYASY